MNETVKELKNLQVHITESMEEAYKCGSPDGVQFMIAFTLSEIAIQLAILNEIKRTSYVNR